MTNLQPHDYYVLKALAEAGSCRAAELHKHFTPGKHNLYKLQPSSLKTSLNRLKKAGLAYIAVKGEGASSSMNETGYYPKGTKIAHRWAVTEDGRLLSGFNPPT